MNGDVLLDPIAADTKRHVEYFHRLPLAVQRCTGRNLSAAEIEAYIAPGREAWIRLKSLIAQARGNDNDTLRKTIAKQFEVAKDSHSNWTNSTWTRLHLPNWTQNIDQVRDAGITIGMGTCPAVPISRANNILSGFMLGNVVASKVSPPTPSPSAGGYTNAIHRRIVLHRLPHRVWRPTFIARNHPSN
jgi:hypothetical protein